MSAVSDFKEAHARFQDAILYITKNEAELRKDPEKWKRIKKNFEKKFEEPLNKAWEALTKEEQQKLSPLFLYRKAMADEQVQKVLKVFKGKIVKILEEDKK